MNKERGRASRLDRKRDLFLAFVIVSLPLLIIALLLVGFVFNPPKHTRPADPSVGTLDLPAPIDVPTAATAYYTGIRSASFALLGSWASNIAEIVIAPFMLIFSYAIAQEVLRKPIKDDKMSELRPPFLGEIVRGSHVGLWHWGRHAVYKKDELAHQGPYSLHVLILAGFGLLIASFLTLLVIAGGKYNWLHATTYAVRFRYYDSVQNYSSLDQDYIPFSSSPAFGLLDRCNEILTVPLPQNISSAPLPCSLNETAGATHLANSDFVYQTLSEGISQVNSSFNRIDFNTLDNKELNGDSTPYQIVTTFQKETMHSIFFNPNPAEESDWTDFGYGPNYGIDYVANTNSMVTNCTMATRECSITARNPSSIKRDLNSISVPFHCYDDFSGNLGQTPTTGHERAQGWNMSFYEDYSGFRRNIPVQSQSNPFQFYAAALVDASGLDNPNGSLVDVGNGFSAFALQCEATVYDVRFSLVNGSFHTFDTNKTSPQKASIIKAPLQVGFGQYHLYEAARVAVLSYDMSIADAMSTAFSQTAMALASGAFDFDNSTGAALARQRWTVEATQVDKAPFWFLVVVCLTYSVFGMAMTLAAFRLRRNPEIRDIRAGLMMELASEMQSTSAAGGKDRGDRPRYPKRASLRSAYSLLS